LPASQQLTPRVLVTTDFSADSERAFYHALSIAVACQGWLTLLHTGSESRDQIAWERFPGVRETLSAWGLLPEDAPRAAVQEQLNLGVTKMAMRDDDPRQGITDYLRKHTTDLLVMATRGRTGFARMRRSSVAETVAYQSRAYSLLLPDKSAGFVDPQDGQARLQRVLCALDPDRDPRQALAFIRQWLPAMGGTDAEVLELRSGSQEILLPNDNAPRWRRQSAEVYSPETIIDVAAEFQPDLLIASTQGRIGLRARMQGSLIDRLLRELQLPLLSIPPR
jgi:nucleotide-binding universal stress UspA family protein